LVIVEGYSIDRLTYGIEEKSIQTASWQFSFGCGLDVRVGEVAYQTPLIHVWSREEGENVPAVDMAESWPMPSFIFCDRKVAQELVFLIHTLVCHHETGASYSS